MDIERLSQIEALNIDKDSGIDKDAYLTALNAFIDNYPENEEKAITTMVGHDYISCSKLLLAVRDLLSKVRAEQLAKECYEHIEMIEQGSDSEKIEADVTIFLSKVAALSIDIQVALNSKQSEAAKADQKTTETSGQEETSDGAPAPANAPTSGGKNILAVDDSSFFLNLIKSFFKDTDYKLTCVNSGKAALRFIQSNSADLFILDIEMPDMNGYELAQSLKDAGQQAPIVFLTANATKKNIIKALNLGAVDFIVKPGNKGQVLAKISKII